MSRAAAAAASRAKSIFRSSTALRNASHPPKLFSRSPQNNARSTPSFRVPRSNITTPIYSRYPVELCCGLLSMMPLHSANASALLTSMLSASSPSCWGWISDVSKDDV